MEKHPLCIKRTLRFSMKLLGVHYSYNNYLDTKKINIQYLKKIGISNVGFFNVLRLFNKLDIPGMGKIKYYPEGSSEAWVNHLVKKKKLKKNTKSKYPAGTILFNKNKNMAMIMKEKVIIHCCFKKGICLEKLENLSEYTHICLPRDWILTD